MDSTHTTDNSLPSLTERRDEWNRHYSNGPTPWDTRQVPPEVITFWESDLLPKRGRAIDIGCGTGTNARFLQGLGLDTVAFDLSATGLAIAQSRRPETANSCDHEPDFVLADVAMLPLHAYNANYILDIGCFHAIPSEARRQYADGVIDNLAAGGYYHVYAHCPLMQEQGNHSRHRGLTPEEVTSLFTPSLSLLTVVHNKPGLRAARWYLLHKPA